MTLHGSSFGVCKMTLRTKAYRVLRTEDDLLNRVQDSIKESLDPILSDLLLNRSVFEALVKTTDTVVAHNLQRIPSGFLISDIDTAANIYRVAWTATTITLKASTPATIKFFLF